MAAAIYLPLSTLDGHETALVTELSQQLETFQGANLVRENYYEGKQRLRDLGIAIPPHLRAIETVVGWPGTVVDVLEERLDIDGWTVPGLSGDLGISDIVEQNDLQTEFSQGHLDALIYGIAFITVGTGAAGEPSPLVTVESPKWMTAKWDRRRRTVGAALAVERDDLGRTASATLYMPDETVQLEQGQGRWTVTSRDRHRLGQTPVFRLVNRPRTGDTTGRSEITRAVRALTDNAVRTVLGMEVAREFFSAPQRYILGADESAFMDADGNAKTAWESYIGKVLALTRDEHGELPQVGTFAASSPEPFLAQLRGLAQLLAAEGGLPASYLGIVTENPSSADAIRAGEVRTIKRAERRQRTFGAVEGQAMRFALRLRDGTDLGVTPRPVWRDPATPTRAASADEAVKLVAAGILPADSEVTWERIGLSETDRQRLRDDRVRARATGTLSTLSAAAEQARTDPVVAGLVDRRDGN